MLKSSKRTYYLLGGVVSLATVAEAFVGGVVSLKTLNDGGVVSFLDLAVKEPIDEAGLTA